MVSIGMRKIKPFLPRSSAMMLSFNHLLEFCRFVRKLSEWRTHAQSVLSFSFVCRLTTSLRHQLLFQLIRREYPRYENLVTSMAYSRTLSVLCGVLLFFSYGLQIQAQENGGAQRTYEVRGIVINSTTHEPIARALVTIAGQESSSSQLTDNEGRFEFPNVRAGGSTLVARRPGFFGSNFSRDLSVPVDVGPDIHEHTLAITPAGTITGQITLPASDPGGNIPVQLMRRNIQEGLALWQPVAMKTTNSEGSFRFGGLQPGEYKLTTDNTIDPDVPGARVSVRWGFSPVSYPEEGDSNASGALKINPGQQVNVQMALTRTPFYPVTISLPGRVVAPGLSAQIFDGIGRPYAASPFLGPQQQGLSAWLPAGNYSAIIQSFSPNSPPGYATQPLTVRDAPVHAEGPAILPVHPISVSIRKDFTAPNNNSNAQILRIENGRQVIEPQADVNLVLISDGGNMGGNLRHEPGGDDSSWQLENVLPGKYWVQPYANQGYVASITAGGTDLARDPLVIGPGGATAPIDIVLRNDTATLSVRLKTTGSASDAGEDRANGYLYLLPQFDSSFVMQRVMISAQASYLPNIPPGTYHAFALDHEMDLEYRNPKALEAYTGKGQIITMEPNGTTNLQIDVTPAEAGP